VLQGAIGPSNIFWIFTGIALLSVFYFVFIFTETMYQQIGASIAQQIGGSIAQQIGGSIVLTEITQPTPKLTEQA